MMLMTILNIMLLIIMCVILILPSTPTLGHLRESPEASVSKRAKCEDINIMKMSFYSHANKTHFHNKGFALGLGLKMERLAPVVQNPPDKSLSTGHSVDIAIHLLNSWRLIFSKRLKWYTVVLICLVNQLNNNNNNKIKVS